MKNELKAVCGMALVIAAVFSAGRAGAEVSIGLEPVAYSVRPAVWGQASRFSSSDRLSETAESLAEAANSGDSAKAEALLAGLYSGASRKEAAAPVYVSNKHTAAAIPAAPAPVATAPEAVTGFHSHYQEDQEMSVSEDAADDTKVDAAKEDAPAAAAADDEGGAKEEAKPQQSFLDTLLGGGIGMLLVILLLLL